MTKKALLIGINYRGSSAELKGCIQDVQHIKFFLLNHCGYAPQNITVITDDSPINPTRKNMEFHMSQFTKNTVSGDTLFLHYSGHGSSIRDRTGDEADSKDEVLVPLDYSTAGVITDDWININLIQKVPKNVTLYGIIDCCNSGSMFDLKFNWRSDCKFKGQGLPKSYTSSDWSNEFSFWTEKTFDTPGNIIMFSGCQDDQTSADAFLDGKNQGAFSYCFIEFLKENLITNTQGQVVFRSGVKLRNVLKEINSRLDINKFTQNSQLSCGQITDFDRPFNLA
jgi:hypothetical protein